MSVNHKSLLAILAFAGIAAFVPRCAYSQSLYDADPRRKWLPYPTVLTVEGEVVPHGLSEGLLVAGSNATVTVEVSANYSVKWMAIDSDVPSLTLEKRDKIVRVTIEAWPATEIEKDPVMLDTQLYGFYPTDDKWISPAREKQEFVFTLLQKVPGVNEYAVSGTGKDAARIPLDKIPEPVIGDYRFRFPIKLAKGPGCHGKYFWRAIVEAEVEYRYGMGKAYFELGPISYTLLANMEDMGEHGSAVTFQVPYALADAATSGSEGLVENILEYDTKGWVFFDKFGKDNGSDPNWFTYWKEDGACPCLKNTPRTIKIHWDFKEKTWGQWDDGIREIWLHPELAAKTHYGVQVSVSSPKPYKFSGPHIWGIYTLEEVVAHEYSHSLVHDEYREKTSFWNTYYSWLPLVDDDSDFHYDSRNKRKKEYWEGQFFDNGQIVTKNKEFKDFIFDSDEQGKYAEYRLDKKNTDSYGLGRIKGVMSLAGDSNYTAYGDDEFLAMMAANKVTEKEYAVATNDWAYPGEQSCIPAEVDAERKAKGWHAWKAAVTPLVDGSAVGTRSAPRLTGASSGDGTGELSLAFGDMASEVVRDAASGRVTAIRILAEVAVSGLEELQLGAELADAQGNVVAVAQAVASSGTTKVELLFDGERIYRSGREGPYHLVNISLYANDGTESCEIGETTDFALADIAVSRGELARKDAYILADVASDTAFTNGISVTVGLDVATKGQYDMSATLCTTGGLTVAKHFGAVECEPGTNMVAMLFRSSDIYDSGLDAPYRLAYVEVCKDGVSLDSRIGLHTLRKLYTCDKFDFEDEEEYGEYDDEYGEYDEEEDVDPDSEEASEKPVYTEESFMALFEDYEPQAEDGQWELAEPEFAVEDGVLKGVSPNGHTVVSVPAGVTEIGEGAFCGQGGLALVAFPASVAHIGANAFSDCGALDSLVFLGNAPQVAENAFDGVPDWCIVYVDATSSGWGETIPETWNGLKVQVIGDEASDGAGATVTVTGGGSVDRNDDGSFTVMAGDGKLSEDAITVHIAIPGVDETIDVTRGYHIAIAEDGARAVVSLKPPEIGVSAGDDPGEAQPGADPDDRAGVLVSLSDVGEGAVSAKPDVDAVSGEELGVLPVKAVRGLHYQAAWGKDLSALDNPVNSGEKVQSTGDTLFLGVIKQKDVSGFYRLSVSDK